MGNGLFEEAEIGEAEFGKGTTSVVPLETKGDAALAAEGSLASIGFSGKS